MKRFFAASMVCTCALLPLPGVAADMANNQPDATGNEKN